GEGCVEFTPIQLLNAYCALANGGTLYKPHVVDQIIGPDGTVTNVDPQVLGEVDASQKVLAIMRRAAPNNVVIRHTSTPVDLRIVMAGKTGTAEFGSGSRGHLAFHTWFVG